MQIEVTTDHNIDATVAFVEQITADVDASLMHFSDRLTRVEVHLHDDGAGKGGKDDKRCVLEARPAGQKPVSVTNHASSVDESIVGALRKLEHLLDSHFGKLDDHKGGDTIRRPEAT